MAHKVIETIERKYYKYSTESVIIPAVSGELQPLATWSLLGNGASLGVKASAYYSSNYPYHALDTVAAGAGGSTDTTTWTINTGYPAWIAWSTPQLYKPSNVRIFTGVNYPKTGTIDWSDDGENWVTITSWTSNVGANSNYTIDIPDTGYGYHRYYRLTITSGSNNSVMNLKAITTTGMYGTIIEGTSSDYDYYEDVSVCKSSLGTVVDISKFMLTGSPTIINGVASNFSSTNIVSCSVPSLTADNFIIKGRFTTGSSGGGYIYKGSGLILQLSPSSNKLFIELGTRTPYYVSTTIDYILSAMTEYNFVLDISEYSGSTYIRVYLNDDLIHSKVVSNFSMDSAALLSYIGSSNGYLSFTGSIDLREVFISSGSTTIFTGSKLGNVAIVV